MKEIHKEKNKKKIIVKVAVIAFVLYVAVSIILLRVDISKRQNELNTVKNELEQQQIFNQELAHIIDSGDASDYIVRMAREKLGFVFPDERVFVDISGK